MSITSDTKAAYARFSRNRTSTGSIDEDDAEQVLVRVLEARQEEAGRVEKSTKTTVARRGTERTSATMATTQQVQEALQQLQTQGARIAAAETQLKTEQPRAATAERELEKALIQTLVTTLCEG